MGIYIPILKYKKAEIKALQKLEDEVLCNVKPLFLMIPKDVKEEEGNPHSEYSNRSVDDFFEKSIRDIQKYFGQQCVYIDATLIYGTKKEEAIKIIRGNPSLFGYNLIPVLRYDDFVKMSATLRDYLQTSEKGICLRLIYSDLPDDYLKNIDDLVSGSGISYENIDLIMDFQIPDNNTQKLALNNLSELLNFSWRNIHFACGAFPKDLSDIKEIGLNTIERMDWKIWNEINKNQRINGRVDYSDYTTQYPIYEAIPAFPNTSFSVKYTRDDSFLVAKGHARNSKDCPEDPQKQYSINALLVTKDSGFKGQNYSPGDRYIHEHSDLSNANHGNIVDWLFASINHHISLTTKQLSA